MATIGGITRFTMGDMVPQQGMQQAPSGNQTPPSGLPPELEALRPKGRSTWQDVLGSIFDAMSAFGGGDPNYWNRVNADKSQFEDLQREYALTKHRLDAQERMKLADRAAKLSEPTGSMRTFQQWQGLSPEDKKAWADYNAATKPPQFVPDGYGGGQWVAPGGGGDAPESLPPDFFDGGATGEQSPGFPR